MNGKCNAAYDLSRKMAPFFDIHIMLFIFNWLEKTNMYGPNEIAKARLELLRHTNMIGYAIDVYKELNGTDETPAEFKGREEGINRQYEDFKDSKLYECMESCLESDSIPTLSDDDLKEFSLTREDMDKSYSLAQFIMNCGDYELALNLISFYIQQIPATTSGDLFHDRMLNLLWGRLTCESLMSLDDGMTTLKELEDVLANIEKVASAAQVLQERSWLVHYGLFLLSGMKNGEDFFVRTFFRKEYLATIELNAPWLLRYLVVVFMKQGRAARVNLSRVIEILERCSDVLEDPILLFAYHLIVRMDFAQAAKELARCEDVFASDFFLSRMGVESEETFMNEARLTILDLIFVMYQRISIPFLAEMLSLSVSECQEFVETMISKGLIDMEMEESREFVKMSKAAPSLYEQVMARKK